MNQREARLFADLVGRAFYLHGHDSHRVFMLKKGDPVDAEFVGFGLSVKKVSDTGDVCGFLNEEYVRAHFGKIEDGTYYGGRRSEVRFCRQPNFPSENDEEVITYLSSNSEARDVADALNEVRKLAIYDKQSAEQ